MNKDEWMSCLPKTLYSRLMWVIMLAMGLVLTTFAVYSGYRDQHAMLKSAETQVSAMAYQVSASSTNLLILGNYAELEDLATRFLEYPSVDFIYIYSPEMKPLVSVKKRISAESLLDDVSMDIASEEHKRSAMPFLSEGYMDIWYPVNSGELLAWIHIRYNLDDVYARISSIWQSITIVVLITWLIVLFGIRKLLRTNIQRLVAATTHARNLIAGDGEQLDSQGLTLEVKELVVALNDASLALCNKGHEAERRRLLLETIFNSQQNYIAKLEAHDLFSRMLEDLLDTTQSEYGFISEILYTESQQPYLKTHAISNIAWNKPTQELYSKQSVTGFEFYNLNTLFGEVILSSKPLLSNDPASHPSSGGLPKGHPPLKAFLGLPIFSGKEMVGMIAIANHEGGYDESDLEFLRPLQTTCGQIIEAYRNENKRAETESRLKESENMLRQVLNTIPTRVFWKDLDGVYLGCNYNFAQDAGFSSEKEIIGKSDYQMPWISEAARYRHDDKIVISNGIPRLKFEEVQTTPSGEQIWLRTSKIPLRNVDETVIGLLGSYDDISEEKKKEQLISDSESRLAVAQHIAQVGSWERNVHSGEHLWSDEVYRILGMEPGRREIGYEDFYQTIVAEDAARIQTLMDTQISLKQAFAYEANILTYDGLSKVVAVRTQFDFDTDGEITRIYGTIQDITERKRMEKMKDDFISTVSHELRTPLTSIKGSLGLITNMMESGSIEKVTSLLSIARNNTDRLLFLINDILDISKIESGHIVFHFQPLDLVALATEAISNNSSYANDVRLKMVAPPQHPIWVNADRDRLSQVIYNLLSNSAKFSHSGGEVEIRIEETEDRIRLSIQDFGVGIDPDFMPKLFEKFTQADSSTSRNVGGTGLGLSISKGIIERHHGQIEVESEVGKGSIFTIVLPIHRVVGESVDGQSTALGPAILICEDDPDVALLLKEMLEAEGYACDVANSADQAKKMLYRKVYAGMTLDIMLPGKDGITLLKELRAEPQFSDLNVIIVSVTADEAHADLEGSALGVSDWLSKPIDETRLLAAMDKLQIHTKGGLPRLLHVEDDQDLIRVVGSLLENIAQIDTALSLKQAYELLHGNIYDLILLDLNLPDGYGLDLLKEMSMDIPVVVFSSEEVNVDTLEQVKAVLLKSRVDNAKLIKTIRQLILTPDSTQSRS